MSRVVPLLAESNWSNVQIAAVAGVSEGTVRATSQKYEVERPAKTLGADGKYRPGRVVRTVHAVVIDTPPGEGEAMDALTGPRPPATVTRHELAVLAAYLETGSEKATAYRLGLAPGTVKGHLANVRRKVGAENTCQATWRLRQELEEAAEGHGHTA